IFDIARGVQGVDVVFGGHTHTFVSTTIEGRPVIVSASHGQAIGEVDLVVNRVTHSARVVGQDLHRAYTDSVTVAPNDPVATIVAHYNADIAPIMARVVGHAPVEIDRRTPAMGNLVADIMRKAARTQIAFTNAGGLRAEIEAGDVTLGNVYEVLP